MISFQELVFLYKSTKQVLVGFGILQTKKVKKTLHSMFQLSVKTYWFAQ